jgi:eukaryotic-like serine/threonine-protein kinase
MPFDPLLQASEVELVFKGRYSGLEPVFVGGQGSVFKAQSAISPNRSIEVALKIYSPDQLAERTDREVAALRRLNSPNLVRLHDSGRISLRGEDCIYVATDFIQGRVLSDLIQAGPLSIRQAARIGTEIAGAIDLLWSERIVHRDIKPPNIMVRNSGSSVLIDLGVARHLSLDSLTAAGMTWGTAGYMSPEHAMARRQLSCKADVFSLGIVLQQCILGRHPTNGRQDLLMGGGVAISSSRIALPDDFSRLLNLMVERDPVRRPLPSELSARLSQWT